MVEYIAGAVEEMEPQTIKMLEKMRTVLGLPARVISGGAVDPLEGLYRKFLPSRGKEPTPSDA